MRLLNITIYTLLIAAIFLSCKSEGPLSPKEAFTRYKNAYEKSDGNEMEKLLSERSKEKIRIIIKMFTQMNYPQLKALGEKFGTNIEKLKNLSVGDYLSIQLTMGKNNSDDIFSEIAKQKIIGVDIKDNMAIARIENGMELVFVKEGRYWKFDIDELSSKN